MPQRRYLSGVIALTVALALQVLSVGGAAAASPASMAATGDSITRAFNTCFFPFTDCPQNSWSTGTSSTVSSHALRLGITSSAFNDAVSGAKMADLGTQMGKVVGHAKVIDYVTVLMGANDVCTSSVAGMTSPSTFEQQLRDGLDVLASSANGKNAIVYVVSIPNVYRLWEILHTNSTAVSRWNSYDICQALLANATSLDPADEARRRTVRARNLELNVVLRSVCAEYAALGKLDCRPDSYTGFRYDFAPTEVSTRDYFHPSATGQKSIAEVTWNVSPYGTATASTAPVAHFTMSCSVLSCSFDASRSVDPDSSTLSYAWDFGDGTTGSGVTTSHAYGAGTTYTVQLTVSDGALSDIDAGTFTLTGASTNTAPTATDVSPTTNEDTAVSIGLSGSDAETCELTFSIVSGPSNGALGSITNASCAAGTLNTDSATVTYTPNLNYYGTDSFTYAVSDGSATDDGTVSITVNPVNDAPVANNDAYSTPAGTTLIVGAPGVLANDSDVDGDTLTAVAAIGPTSQGGSYSLTATGSFEYTPKTDFTGTDSFDYTVSDGNLTDTGTVYVTVGSLITLSAVGYKLKGVQHAELSWSGAISTNVDVYRDGVLIDTTPNDGAYTDLIGKKGGGSYVYKVCEVGTQTCSNEATVSF